MRTSLSLLLASSGLAASVLLVDPPEAEAAPWAVLGAGAASVAGAIATDLAAELIIEGGYRLWNAIFDEEEDVAVADFRASRDADDVEASDTDYDRYTDDSLTIGRSAHQARLDALRAIAEQNHPRATLEARMDEELLALQEAGELEHEDLRKQQRETARALRAVQDRLTDLTVRLDKLTAKTEAIDGRVKRVERRMDRAERQLFEAARRDEVAGLFEDAIPVLVVENETDRFIDLRGMLYLEGESSKRSRTLRVPAERLAPGATRVLYAREGWRLVQGSLQNVGVVKSSEWPSDQLDGAAHVVLRERRDTTWHCPAASGGFLRPLKGCVDGWAWS